MTKKDYELIASAIKLVKLDRPGTNDDFLDGYYTAIEAIELQLSADLLKQNERFDRVKFLTACESWLLLLN